MRRRVTGRLTNARAAAAGAASGVSGAADRWFAAVIRGYGRLLDRVLDRQANVHHLNPELVTKFTTETGKILQRRVTGVPAWLHRKIVREIKRARAINLMP